MPGGRRLFVVLGGAAMIGPLAMSSFLPGLPALARDFGVSASEAQVTITTFLVGLALGQFLAGPLSDTHGRRRPLIGGMALYTIASLLCSLAPNLAALATLRLVQGFVASTGMTIGRAVINDVCSGAAAARYMSRLMLIVGLAPILAPLLGAQVLHVSSWRGVFVALALLGVALTSVAALFLPETLPGERRRAPGVQASVRACAMLLTERRFVGFALVCGLGSCVMFAYIAASPFVLQNIYGASPQLYGLLFGCNAVTLVAASQVNALAVMRRGPVALIGFGLSTMLVAGVTLVVAVLSPNTALSEMMVPLLLLSFSWSFIQTNAMAAAVVDHPEVLGTATAVLGVSQFALGAVATPFVGLGGDDTALPLALVVLVCGIGAAVSFKALVLTDDRAVSRRRPVGSTGRRRLHPRSSLCWNDVHGIKRSAMVGSGASDGTGVTVLDSRELEWEDVPNQKRWLKLKVLSRLATGEPGVYLAWLRPGPYLERPEQPFRHYHLTAREIRLQLWGELRQWEYGSAAQAHGELVRWREGWYMDRTPGPGSIHGFEPSPEAVMPIGSFALHVRTAPGTAEDEPVFARESPVVPYPPDATEPGSRGPDVAIVDSRAVEWEPWPGQPEVKVKPLSRFESGAPEVCLLWLPPGEREPRLQRHRTAREHFFVVAGELRSGAARVKEGGYVEIAPGAAHYSEPEAASSVGVVVVYWRTAPGTFRGEPEFEQETEELP